MPAIQPEAKACLGSCCRTIHRSGTKATQARRLKSTLGKARAKRIPLAAASAVCLRRTIEGRNVPWRGRKRKYTRSIEKRQQDVDFQRKRYGEWALSEKGAGGQRC